MNTRNRRSIALLGVLSAVTAGAGMSLSTASARSSDAVFTLSEHYSAPTFVSISGSPSPVPGDENLFRAILTQNGTRVGTLEVVCQYVLHGKLQCTSTYQLTGGNLSVSTLTTPTSTTIHNAITGGTGRYDTAHGQVTEQENPQNLSIFTATFDID